MKSLEVRTLFTLYASPNCGEVLCTGGKGTEVPAATPLAGHEVEGKGGEGRKVGGGLGSCIRAWVWEPDLPGLVFQGVLESTLASGSTFLILRLLICKMGELSLSCVMVPTSEEGFSETFKVPSSGGPAARTRRFLSALLGLIVRVQYLVGKLRYQKPRGIAKKKVLKINEIPNQCLALHKCLTTWRDKWSGNYDAIYFK